MRELVYDDWRFVVPKRVESEFETARGGPPMR
jgi:hypothetical protein